MALQKINWLQIDSTNVPSGSVIDVGAIDGPLHAGYFDNLFISGTSLADYISQNPGGGGGGNGFLAASGNRGGGSGGGCANFCKLYVPTFLIPNTLYILPGVGGAGGSAGTVDIIRQVSTSRYRVTDGTRRGTVQLKSSVASAVGEASIRAVDSAGGTYFVTKLTAHLATVTQGTGTQFATGSRVRWTFGAPTASQSVQIDNA